jgi:HEAT repeat protein/outer membrane protein assembly factor BamB
VSAETSLPVFWNADEGVVWKSPVSGTGFSSPIVWDDRVFLTTGRDNQHLMVLAYRRSDGTTLWSREFDATGPANGLGDWNTVASPTPATNGKAVVALFATGDVVCLDFDGKDLWRRSLAKDYGEIRNGQGLAASPVIWRDIVLLQIDHSRPSYLLALNIGTGETRWKIDRPAGDSWSTPLLLNCDGDPLVVACCAGLVKAYSLETREEVWRCGGLTVSIAPSPVCGDDRLFATSGRNGPFLAIRTGGKGDVEATHLEWRHNRSGPYVPSPVYCQGRLQVTNDSGFSLCFDAATGDLLWQERLPGRFSASGVAADGKLYFLNESGETFVLRAGPKFEMLARNPLGEPCKASPAVSAGQVFIRSDKHLFCIGAGVAGTPGKAAAGGQNLTTGQWLEALKDPDRQVRLRAAEALGHDGDPNALAELKRVMLNDHWDVSEVAIKAIGNLGGPAVPVLIESLRDSRPFVRWEATAALGRMGTPDAAGPLAAQARDAEPLVRVAVAEAMGCIRGSACLAALSEAAQDKDAAVRLAAVAALGKFDPEPALPSLLKALDDPSRLVRIKAVAALGRRNSEAVVRALRERADKEGDPAVKRALDAALREIGGTP